MVDFVKGQRKDDVMHEHLAPDCGNGVTPQMEETPVAIKTMAKRSRIRRRRPRWWTRRWWPSRWLGPAPRG
jgi:hypothetical protein